MNDSVPDLFGKKCDERPKSSNGNNNQTLVGYMSDLCLQQLFVHSEPAICFSTTR
jgi:hypothetical protein